MKLYSAVGERARGRREKAGTQTALNYTVARGAQRSSISSSFFSKWFRSRARSRARSPHDGCPWRSTGQRSGRPATCRTSSSEPHPSRR
eukprot:3130576-Heterocapsa_arctica.AAC.1